MGGYSLSTTRAIVYRRISDDERYESGGGLAAQLDACKAFCDRNGWEMVGPIDEAGGMSGDTPVLRRPGLCAALEELKRGDILLVWKRSRIARDTKIIFVVEQVLREKKCRMVSTQDEGTLVDDPDDIAGVIMRTVTDLIAQIELLNTKFNTRATLRAKKRRGERTGGVPFGSDVVDDGRRSKPKRDRNGNPYGNLPIKLVPNPLELEILARAVELRRDGWTYDRIVWAMNRRGIKTKRGKVWSRSSLRFILLAIEADPCHPVRNLVRPAQDPPSVLPTSFAI